MGIQNFECGLHLVDVGTTTDVQEVSRGASIQLNNVHGAHGETSTVHKAANVTVESNVGQASLDGLFFMRINVFTCNGSLSQLNEFLLSELSVIIDVDLSIDAVESILGVSSPWVDFDLSSIELIEHSVKVSDLLFSIVGDVGQLELAHNSVQVSVSQTSGRADRVDNDALRISLGDFFDFDTTVDAGHDSRLLRVSVEHESKVDLADDVNTFVDQHCVDLKT